MKSVVPIDKNAELPISAEPEVDTKKQHRSVREFMKEMKQRRVCRAAITYVLFMWLNLQIADVLVPMIGLPAWTLQLIVTIGAMGFPAALLLAWIFQVTPQGVVVDDRQPSTEQPSSGWLETAASMFLLAISLILTTLLILNFVAERETSTAGENSLLVRELKFYGVSDQMEKLARSLELEVRHRMVNLDKVKLQVTSGSTVQSDHPGLRIVGSISEKEGRFYILVQMVETSSGQYISSVVIEQEVPPLAVPQEFLADIVLDNILSKVRT